MKKLIPPAPLTPIGSYLRHRVIVADRVRIHGIRNTARATKIAAMTVSRYCDATGGHDALTHYILADFVGLTLRM